MTLTTDPKVKTEMTEANDGATEVLHAVDKLTAEYWREGRDDAADQLCASFHELSRESMARLYDLLMATRRD